MYHWHSLTCVFCMVLWAQYSYFSDLLTSLDWTQTNTVNIKTAYLKTLVHFAWSENLLELSTLGLSSVFSAEQAAVSQFLHRIIMRSRWDHRASFQGFSFSVCQCIILSHSIPHICPQKIMFQFKASCRLKHCPKASKNETEAAMSFCLCYDPYVRWPVRRQWYFTISILSVSPDPQEVLGPLDVIYWYDQELSFGRYLRCLG